MHKKISLFILIFCTSALAFSQNNFGTELAKHSDLSFELPLQLNTGAVWNYAKASYGVEARIGTQLFTIEDKDITAGICTTFVYNDSLLKREEIEILSVYGLTQGIWISFPVTQKLRMVVDAGGIFCVSRLKAESIDIKKIDSYFNSCGISTRAVVTAKLFETASLCFDWNAGANLKILYEKNNMNETFGLIAGITIKAGKK